MLTKIKLWNEYFTELWEKHSLLIVILTCALLFDTLSTIGFMTKGGIHLEFHPLVRYSAFLLGPVTGTILSSFCFKVIVSIMLAMFLRSLRLWILIIPAITATCAGFYNFFWTLAGY